MQNPAAVSHTPTGSSDVLAVRSDSVGSVGEHRVDAAAAADGVDVVVAGVDRVVAVLPGQEIRPPAPRMTSRPSPPGITCPSA